MANSQTKVAMFYDTTSNKEVMNVKMHVVAGTESTDQSVVIASVWKNKNYDFSIFRKENLGKTFNEYQEGVQTTVSKINAENAAWNALGGNQISLMIV